MGLAAEFAPAKINLCLHVTGQRDDGYHLLDSLVAFANIGDELRFSTDTEKPLVIDGEMAGDLNADADNLVLRAAKLMGVDDAAFVLTKNLPVASGIGGGSADAAAAMRLISKEFNITIDAETAAKLGADVPICLTSKSAHMKGIGDVIAPVPLPDFPAVLVNPNVAIATPEVFEALPNKANSALPKFPTDAVLGDWLSYLQSTRNDLLAPALSLQPVIEMVLTRLRDSGAGFAQMSGSGATCFGLYETSARAKQACDQIKAAMPDWWVCETILS